MRKQSIGKFRLTSRALLTPLFRTVILFWALQPFPSQAQKIDWPDENQCQQASAASDVIEGWCIAIDRRRGNCVACHTFNISPWPINLPVAGNIAPPMVAMQGRFPDKQQLRMIIEDATVFNQKSSMPPYLKHGILSTQEIELLVDFLLGI